MARKNCEHCGAELFWVNRPTGDVICLDNKREPRWVLSDIGGRLTAKKTNTYSQHAFTCPVIGKRAK